MIARTENFIDDNAINIKKEMKTPCEEIILLFYLLNACQKMHPQGRPFKGSLFAIVLSVWCSGCAQEIQRTKIGPLRCIPGFAIAVAQTDPGGAEIAKMRSSTCLSLTRFFELVDEDGNSFLPHVYLPPNTDIVTIHEDGVFELLLQDGHRVDTPAFGVWQAPVYKNYENLVYSELKVVPRVFESALHFQIERNKTSEGIRLLPLKIGQAGVKDDF